MSYYVKGFCVFPSPSVAQKILKTNLLFLLHYQPLKVYKYIVKLLNGLKFGRLVMSQTAWHENLVTWPSERLQIVQSKYPCYQAAIQT